MIRNSILAATGLLLAAGWLAFGSKPYSVTWVGLEKTNGAPTASMVLMVSNRTPRLILFEVANHGADQWAENIHAQPSGAPAIVLPHSWTLARVPVPASRALRPDLKIQGLCEAPLNPVLNSLRNQLLNHGFNYLGNHVRQSPAIVVGPELQIDRD